MQGASNSSAAQAYFMGNKRYCENHDELYDLEGISAKKASWALPICKVF